MLRMAALFVRCAAQLLRALSLPGPANAAGRSGLNGVRYCYRDGASTASTGCAQPWIQYGPWPAGSKLGANAERSMADRWPGTTPLKLDQAVVHGGARAQSSTVAARLAEPASSLLRSMTRSWSASYQMTANMKAVMPTKAAPETHARTVSAGVSTSVEACILMIISFLWSV